MSGNFIKTILGIFVIFQTQLVASKYLRVEHRQDFSLLLNFTCAVAKDELEKHPEMRTIAMVELENNFPFDFSEKVLKCLPVDVAKVNLNPHTHENVSLMLPKESMIIYVADRVEWIQTFFVKFQYFKRNFHTVSHLSKFLVVRSSKSEIELMQNVSNVVQIYEENRKIIAKSLTQNLTTLKSFEGSRHENLSQVLFPDKSKNLNGSPLIGSYVNDIDAYNYSTSDRPNNKWIYFLDIVAEKLNLTLEIVRHLANLSSQEAYKRSVQEFLVEERFDFHLNYFAARLDLTSYNNVDNCFIAPLPKPFSITELILLLPMDKSCWMWLGITITVSTLLWRISEGHWNFFFGAFAHFTGQSQLVNRIKTSRLTMKILLQLWIFSIFVFSNGYQSIVTSFMSAPTVKVLKSYEEILDSKLYIKHNKMFHHALENPKYKKAVEDGRVNKVEIGYQKNWTNQVVAANLAWVQPCAIMKNRIEYKGDGKSWRRLYLIPEVVYSVNEDLYTRPLNPLLDKFQELMDRTFEVGLHQAWERFFWEIFIGDSKKEKRPWVDTNLGFKEIIPFFLILAVGFGSALLALFCEIFHRDFVSQLTKNYFKRKFDEIFRRKIKVTKIEAKPKKVRRIEVRPKTSSV